MERRLAAILVADVAGYSRLVGKDEEGTLRTLSAYREVIDGLVAEHRGRIFGGAGDSVIAEFASPVEAVRCAAEVQGALADRNADLPEDRRMEFRMGINLGDVVVEGDNLLGDGVNVAARLQELAEPGGVCVSDDVYRHVEAKVELEFTDLGEQQVKNIAKPVRVYRVQVDGTKSAVGTAAPKIFPLPDKPSIAVLPFTNISGDPEQKYFSDGITEDIITDLSRVSGFFVIARNSTFTYERKAAKVQQVSKELEARYVLEGSVRKAGERIRITAQLVDGATGGHLWADRYDRDLTDIFAVQDEITYSIVDALKVKLLLKESRAIRDTPTENIEAYEFYLRGRQIFHRHSKASFDIARRMFSKAIELDPRYARAYAGVADCDSFLYLWYRTGVSLDGILAASAKALELNHDLAEAHASHGLALSVNERHVEAEGEFETAIGLDPNLFEGYYFYARACFTQGKYDQAAKLLERASEVRPDDYQSLMLLAAVYRSLGRERVAEAADRRCFERAERELHLRPEDARAAYCGALALISMGERTRAKEWASRALSIDPDDFLVQYNVAGIHSRLGELDQAIDSLERLLPQATREDRMWLDNDSDMDSLRDHPRFQALLRRLTS